MLAKLFKRRAGASDPVHLLYARLVEKARDPQFYAAYGVPDTVDGRFDMVVIHAMLVIRRLRDGAAGAHDTGQRLFNLMFKDMDRSLREMGVGDMSISKHIKRMTKAFYGRASAYEAGLDGSDETLARALLDNLFRHVTPPSGAVAGVAGYLRRATGHLASQSVDDIVAGRLDLAVPVEGGASL